MNKRKQFNAMKMDDVKLSEKVELILDILDQCVKDYKWYKAQLEADENKVNTLRHELEGVGINHRKPPGYNDRARIATELQTVLISRRVSKDNIALNEPMVCLINSDVGKNIINQLRQRLGETRKIESKNSGRIFYRRQTENSSPENQELKRNLNKLIHQWKKRNNTQ
jgi:hypothetical protein